jgi:hypothetical protein
MVARGRIAGIAAAAVFIVALVTLMPYIQSLIAILFQ